MACDICGKSEMMLQQLNKEYQSDKIKDICTECSKKVNDHLWTLRLWSSNDQPCDTANEADLWRCTVCGRTGTVGRCCGEETREPVRAPND